jgi:hypothetical protein
MAKFKKGDRVRVVKVTSLELANNIFAGDTGTVLEDGSESPYVRMDKYNKSFSSACGLCDEGHGYALTQSQIKLLESDSIQDAIDLLKSNGYKVSNK